MPGTHECGGDAAAYVLGALDPAEAARFRAHLESCVVCRDEVAALQQVGDALPLAVPPQPVPRALRRRVMAEVRADAREARREPARARPRFAPQLPRPALAGALTVILAAAVLGGVELGSGGSGQGVRVFAAVKGDAQLRLSGRHAELIVRHLAEAPAGRIYEVWLARPGRPPSPTSALFGVTSAGHGDVIVPGNLHGVSAVLVTQEPAGGSRVPTGAPVIVARIA